MSDKNIFGSREIGIGCRMLINSRNAVLLCNKGIRHDDFLSVKDNFSPVRLVHSCQRLDKGGFARSVFPDNGMNFSLFQVKTHIIQCFHTRKNLGDMIHFQQIFRHLHPSRESVSPFTTGMYIVFYDNNAIF